MSLRSRLLAAVVGATLVATLAPAVGASEGPVGDATVVVAALVEAPSGGRTVERIEVRRDEAASALARLLRRPDVVTAAVDHPVRAFGDPREKDQWHLSRTGPLLPAAGQVLAVLDTGVQADHPDLLGIVRDGIDLVGGSGCPGTCDANGHGTHIAGLAAAVAGNGVGGRGVAGGLEILPVRVLDDAGYGSVSTVVEGIEWAVAHGATVINLSLGGPQPTPILRESVAAAVSAGVVIVAAAGNAGTSTPNYPAAFDDVLGVTAVDAKDARPSYASYGPWLDLAAPGTALLSTLPPSGYGPSSGTSMAAPLVAATAASLLSQGEAPRHVRSRLRYRSRDVGPAGFDGQTGFGILDVAATTAPVPTFADIRQAGSHAGAVRAVAATGVTVGCGDKTTYCPLAPVTRAEMATFLWRAARLAPSTTRRFADTAGLSHEPAINAIAEAGITVGCGDKTIYCPSRHVTRAEMATFLARALGLPLDAPDRFTDDQGSSHEAAINAIAREGITVGCGDKTVFCPGDRVTRAEMATFLTRAFDL